jgi:hypothetical protein
VRAARVDVSGIKDRAGYRQGVALGLCGDGLGRAVGCVVSLASSNRVSGVKSSGRENGAVKEVGWRRKFLKDGCTASRGCYLTKRIDETKSGRVLAYCKDQIM